MKGRNTDDEDEDGRVRLDKWLWAARFFRTRMLAKAAIEAGHVRYEGDRAKVSREVQPGARLTVRQGWDEVEVVVRALDTVRRGAPEARQLYEETDRSRQRREDAALARRATAVDLPSERPSKKDRRLIQQLKQRFVDDWT
ncbi:MAG TPA: S4 domain-containing protein [Nevskiaceae bacterium]|nr:S4 domain-containing protein [Nevskiaceae bacterium]